MAEEKKQETKKEEKKKIVKTPEKTHGRDERQIEEGVTKLIRILGKDIPGNKNVYTGLTRIKGISWSFSNAVCKSLNLDKAKKMEDLDEVEIKKITDFLRNPTLPNHLLNSRRNFETGESKQLFGSDLDMRRDFDIKRLKKIRSYRGWRHALGQPVRGQRTRNHFRKNKAVGVGKKVNKTK